MGEHCPVLQLCPTHFHTLCPFQSWFFWTKSSFLDGWIHPSCSGVRSAPCWFVWASGNAQDVLDTELVLLVPVPLLLWFPVSINTPEEQHHILFSNMEIPVISQKPLCIDLPPPAFGFFSFYPLLGSSPDLQKSRNVSRTKNSVAILPHGKEHFPGSRFPIPPALPLPKEEVEISFLLSPSSAWTLIQWNWAAWDEIILFIQKWNFLKGFVGLEMCGLKSPGFGYWCVKLCVWHPDYSLLIIEIN